MTTINKLAQTIMPPAHCLGTVTHCFADGSITVESDGLGWHCRRAVGCLIVPQAGDRVIISSMDNQIWLLMVLERDEDRQVELNVLSDLHIRSAGKLSLSGQSLRVNAQKGDCHINEMNYSGDKLSVWVNLSRIVGERTESVWQTVIQISHHLLRTTRWTEQVRAGQLDIKAEDYARLHARNTVITSKAITKVDSEQIHMG